MRIRKLARPSAVAVLYSIAALLLTWPLAAVVTHQVAGDASDTLFNCWVLQWTSGQVMRALHGDLSALRTRGVDVRAGEPGPQDVDGATVVVVSPGIPPTSPIFAEAAARDVPVWGEMELGARLARVPYLAVTGTNGKTTVTGMIASSLRAAGFDAVEVHLDAPRRESVLVNVLHARSHVGFATRRVAGGRCHAERGTEGYGCSLRPIL